MLSELKYSELHISFSDSILKILFKIVSGNLEQAEMMIDLTNRYWFSVDPELLLEFTQTYGIALQESEIIEYSIYLCSINHYKKAICLIKAFKCIVIYK